MEMSNTTNTAVATSSSSPPAPRRMLELFDALERDDRPRTLEDAQALFAIEGGAEIDRTARALRYVFQHRLARPPGSDYALPAPHQRHEQRKLREALAEPEPARRLLRLCNLLSAWEQLAEADFRVMALTGQIAAMPA